MNRLGALGAARPRCLASIAAVLAGTAAFSYTLSQEPPVGEVVGTVVLAETHTSISGAEINLTPEDSPDDGVDSSRSAHSGLAGEFHVGQVRAGRYRVAASTKGHAIGKVLLYIHEGSTAHIVLALTRTGADLELAQHQHVYRPSEQVQLPVKGYVQPGFQRGQDSVRVTLYRTRLSYLAQNIQPASLNSGLSQLSAHYDDSGNLVRPASLPPAMLHPAAGPAPTLAGVYGRAILKPDREGAFFQRLTLGALPRGLYLAQINHAAAGVCTWVLVTDAALVVKRSKNQVLGYAVNVASGLPLHNAQLRVYARGRLLAARTTDKSGLADLPISPAMLAQPGSGVDGAGRAGRPAPISAVVVDGDNEAIIERQQYGSEDGTGDFRVHAYTDRPIYRPGQHISFKGIVRRVVDPGIKYGVPGAELLTAEVRDPGGVRVLRLDTRTDSFGSFIGALDLSPEARTGVYTLAVTIHGEVHTHDIVVASYKKPEYQVTVTPEQKTYVGGDTVRMTISAQYYFGAPVAGAKVHYSFDLEDDWSAAYPDDYGYDPNGSDSGGPGSVESDYTASADSYRGQVKNSGDIRLDENGKAVVTYLDKRRVSPDAPQQETVTLSANVVDDADREVDASGRVSVSAGDYRLTVEPAGYVAQPGKPCEVLVTARSIDGKPVPGLSITLDSGYPTYSRADDSGNRQVVKYTQIARQTSVTGPAGRASLFVTPDRSGELRLSVTAYDAHDRMIRARAYLWAAGEDGGDLSAEYGDLTLLTDRRSYKPGDTARVLVNASKLGETALLTVEGQRVYASYLVPVTKHSTISYVPILAQYGPNVTLAACYVKDKLFSQSQVQLRVTVPARNVTIRITPDRAPVAVSGAAAALATYHPRDTVTYHINTSDGQGRPLSAQFSLGVVDESIYALAEDDPKALMDAFYPFREDLVQTVYSFEVEYLGDTDKAEPKITARKEFPDTVFWQPLLQTDSHGSATVQVPLKDNLTTWRATVAAQTMDSAFGWATSKVLATKEFFVRVETPRFLTETDQSQLTAIVHNETNAAQTAVVRLRLQGAATTEDLTRTVEIKARGSAQIAWAVTAGRSTGMGVDVSAWTPRTPSGSQYTDRVQISVPIRAHGRELVWTHSGDLTTGETYEIPTVAANAVPRETRLTVNLTPSVTGAMVGALDYLVGFPYGCTEQTMSRFLPDLMVQRVLAARSGGQLLTASTRAALPVMVRDGLSRLARFQHKSGAWGWWQADKDDAWMTAYVLYGLATARDDGYPVDRAEVATGCVAAMKMVSTLHDKDSMIFLLYAVALAGNPAQRAAVRMHAAAYHPDALAAPAVAYLALLNRELGEDAGPEIVALNRLAVTEGDLLYWKQPANSYEWDAAMTSAAAMRAMLSANSGDPRIAAVMRRLMQVRTGIYWGDTRDTAWVLAAFCDYLKAHPQSAGSGGTVTVKVNGNVVQSYNLNSDISREKQLQVDVPQADLRVGKNNVALIRSGGGSDIFYSVELRQLVTQESLPALSPTGITVTRTYMRRVPQKTADFWTLKTEQTNNQLAIGDQVLVRLVIKVPRDMNYVLIEDALPSGCEVTERANQDDVVDWSYWWSAVDIRDDRIAFFAREMPKGTYVVEYNLRAQTAGTCRALPTLVQDMYAPAEMSYSDETRLVVR